MLLIKNIVENIQRSYKFVAVKLLNLVEELMIRALAQLGLATKDNFPSEEPKIVLCQN